MRHNKRDKYPEAVDISRVGKYPLEVFSGGGYFYDDVLEYRVWTTAKGKTVCYSFGTYGDAETFFTKHEDAEKPLVLVRQLEYIDEQMPGVHKHIKEVRLAEWQPEWLEGSKGTALQIPLFLKSNSKSI